MFRRFVIPLAVAIGVCSTSPMALAQTVDEATQDAARVLGKAGLELFDKGDFATALPKFQQAYSLYQAPTLGLLSARCLAKLGLSRDAIARYREVAAMDLGPSPTEAFVAAKKTAEQEGAELYAKVPKVLVVISGAQLNEVAVTIDGKPVDSADLSEPQLVEAGARHIEGKKGDQSVSVEVTAAEGQTANAALNFTPKKEAPKAAAPPPPAPGFWTPKTHKIAGFIGVGLGGAGILTGAILSGVVTSKKSFLDGEGGCVDGACPEGVKGDVNTYNKLRVGTTVSYVVGAALGGAGVALLLTAPREGAPPPGAPPAKKASDRGGGLSAELSIGLSSLMLKGEF